MWDVRIRFWRDNAATAQGLGLLSRGDRLDGAVAGLGMVGARRCIRVCSCGYCYTDGRLTRRHRCGNRALALAPTVRGSESTSRLRSRGRTGGPLSMHHRLEQVVSLGRRTFRLWRRVESGKLSARLGRCRPDTIARAVRRVWGLLLGLPILID